MELEEFIKQPFNKQLHLTVLAYLSNEHIAPYEKGKPCQQYFKVRAYLWQLDRQYIKNIWIMLQNTNQHRWIYSLQEDAQEYIRQQQVQCESKKQAEIAKTTDESEYQIDVLGWLAS